MSYANDPMGQIKVYSQAQCLWPPHQNNPNPNINTWQFLRAYALCLKSFWVGQIAQSTSVTVFRVSQGTTVIVFRVFTVSQVVHIFWLKQQFFYSLTEIYLLEVTNNSSEQFDLALAYLGKYSIMTHRAVDAEVMLAGRLTQKGTTINWETRRAAQLILAASSHKTKPLLLVQSREPKPFHSTTWTV